MNRGSHHCQCGAATLVVVLVLLFAMTLVAAFANRNLIFEQRTSANQVRSTQAFEAAEAGLEWAQAMLNRRDRLGPDCQPSSRFDAVSFRERSLRYSVVDGMHAPTTLRAACVHAGQGWTCSCPTQGLPSLPAPTDGTSHPGFSVEFGATTRPGLVRLIASGRAGADASSTQVQVLLALVPGLSTPPVAPLTVKESVSVSGALGLHNPDAAAGGLVLDAGGTVAMPNLRITTAAGGAAAAASVERDAALSTASAASFFTGFFGLDKDTWSDQPAVAHLRCASNCGTELSAAIDAATLIHIDGDLQLEGPLTLGTRERPVLLVASGAVTLNGAVAIHGVVYGSSVAWNATGGGGAWVRGAVVSETGFQGNASPDLIYDSAVLAMLKGNSGSFARVPGSWKDF